MKLHLDADTPNSKDDFLDSSILIQSLKNIASPILQETNQRFFNRKEGSPGQHDQWLGINTPSIRHWAKIHHSKISDDVLCSLGKSHFNEIRLASWHLMALQKKPWASWSHLMLENMPFAGNWNVVDTAAPECAKVFLRAKKLNELNDLSLQLYKQNDIWSLRASVVLAWPCIRQGHFEMSQAWVSRLAHRQEPMIAKAVGWMARELYRSNAILGLEWIQKHADMMPSFARSQALELATQKEKEKIKENLKKKKLMNQKDA